MLEKYPTQLDEALKAATKKETKDLADRLEVLQKMMLAGKQRSLLIVLQGMDASGKDGIVSDVFHEVNPQGVNVKNWGKPTEEEFAHDFLWRIHQHTPAKGMIQVFNRSHYEDILVPTVEGYIAEDLLERRYEYINMFEQLLEDNGTKVLKFYLHLSKEKQEERLRERIEIPRKHYKHNDGDWAVREKWDEYMDVYEEIFERCSVVPWTIVPADQNWAKSNVVIKKVVAALEAMDLKWPALQSERFK